MSLSPKSVHITVSVTGKIPRKSFENYSPYFSLTEIYGESPDITDEWRTGRQATLQEQLNLQFEKTRERIVLEELQSQFKNLRFTLNPEDGKKYPHVTDILYWDADFYIPDSELVHYGARGSAVHAMIDNWILTKEWDEDVVSKRDLIILRTGFLDSKTGKFVRLYDTLPDINFLGFMEEYGKDIQFGEGEFRGFNKEHFYCGQPDRIGTFKKKKTLFDWKCRAAKDDDFKQMAMYTRLDDKRMQGIEQMVVVPLNPENKQGYGRPVVSTEIEKYFNLALRDRRDYREKFGI